MTNTIKLIAAAALVTATSTATFAGGLDPVVYEEPVIIEEGLTPNYALLALGAAVVACAIACGSSGGDNDDDSSSTTTN